MQVGPDFIYIATRWAVNFMRAFVLKGQSQRSFLVVVGWLCLTSHRQQGHLVTAPPFTVPCEGREARFLHRSHWQSNPGPSRGSPLRNRCPTPAPRLSN